MADTALVTEPLLNFAVPPGGLGLLRFTTAGSVDDGKSTLIGRLLYDSQGVYEDQIDAVRKSRINRAAGPLDFSLVTDGLRAEREQGITIDVAYRYFSTPRRKFIIADTPGHEQYTRNMATGASTADLAVVLIDATKGVLPQSRRHAYIASLLGIRYLVAAVNKMDLVGCDETTFRRIRREFQQLADQLEVSDVCAIPLSALEGDNVVRRSARMPWFEGPALLEYLETVSVNEAIPGGALRFPVQYVIRPNAHFRGFAGQLTSGTLRTGDSVIALPSGSKTRVRSILTLDGELGRAIAGEAITVTLDDEIDLSRGDLLVSEDAPPVVSRHVRAQLVWMHAEPLDRHKLYLLKHTTRTVRARIRQVLHRVDINSLQHAPASAVSLNEITTVDLETTLPLMFDPYRVNRTMGSFILIDPISNATVAAGMIEGKVVASASTTTATQSRVFISERQERFGHRAGAVWIENQPLLAEELERVLFGEGWLVQLISSTDFLSSELSTVARALRLSGAIAVFAVAGTEDEQRKAFEELFGSDAFFTVDARAESTQSLDELLFALRKWRRGRRTDATDAKGEAGHD
jgi:sulfate adenylyltransferase large subunit